MSVLICGSFAYDTIMLFPGKFRDEILPDKVHMLNVSFLVPQMRREFGGCAGNIAYNLKLLGGDPLPMGTVGTDFITYAAWMDKHKVPRTHVRELPGNYTAQAYIVTDMEDNQITAFHPGAMNESHTQDIEFERVTLGTVSPDGKEGMLLHARQFTDADIPFLFDPGQGLPMFSGEQLRKFITRASYVAVNDYEAAMMAKKTGWTLKQMSERVDALIVTHGGKGSHIHVKKKTHKIPPAKPKALKDPTGCGDAYRAGLLFGIENEYDWETTGRIAALMGTIKIEKPGTQNHTFTPASFKTRFKKEFKYAL